MKPCEEISETATNQARAVNGVLDTNRCDDAQVREEVTGELAIETHRVEATEHEYAVELLVTPQGNQREAARARGTLQQQLMILPAERPKPGTLQVRQPWRYVRYGVDELHLF